MTRPDAPPSTPAPEAVESEPRCALCRLARVRAAGLTCRACGADLDAMHRGRQW